MRHNESVDDATVNSKPPGDKREDWLAEWPLDGGSTVRFRHVRPEDEPFISEAIRTASRETLLHRFFSPIRSVSPDQLRAMLAIDRRNGACIVGVLQAGAATRIICGARYVRLPTPGAAEIAVTVHDDFQRRGLGEFGLRLLARLAMADGIRWFEADVMNSNRKMLNLFVKLAPNLTRTRRMGDVVHLRFEATQLANSPENDDDAR